MKRVVTAIQKGRCVLIAGSRVQSEPASRAALAERPGLPIHHLGARDLNADDLAAVIGRQGGLLVLVEPDALADGHALEQLASVLKKSKAKPNVLLVAPIFNPFGLPIALRLMRVEHEKAKASDLLGALPTSAPQGEAAAAAPAKKKKSSGAPRPVLVGREEEKVALAEALIAGGPVLLHGASGVGRSWLLSEVLSEQEGLTQVFNYSLRRDAGFDGLSALIADALGDDEMKKAFQEQSHESPAAAVDALIAALSTESAKGQVITLRGIEGTLYRDGSMARSDRLGMLVQALLTRPGQTASVVMISAQAPRIHGVAEVVQTVQIAGIKGREVYGIFEAYHAEEVPRDKMGEVHNQTAGHPMGVRAYAVRWRDSEQREKVFEDKKFLKMVQAENTEVLQRHLIRRVEKLSPVLKKALFLIGHSPVGLTGQELSSVEISRESRVQLTRLGLVEVSLHGDPRIYSLHPVIARGLPLRDLADFDTMEQVARLIAGRVASLSGAHKLALSLEINRTLVAARRERSRRELDYLDQAGMLDSVLGLIRGRTPRLEMALQRVNQLLKQSPKHPELLLAKAEVLGALDGDAEEIEKQIHHAQEVAPTPEAYHFEATWRLRRRRKGDQGRATDALTRGRVAFPLESSLARRLGAVLAEQRQWEQAEIVLRESIELDASQPEAYSRLGEVLSAQGSERYGDAANAIRYALELEPGREVHQRRLARLLRQQSLIVESGREALITEAKELLEASLKGGVKGHEPYLELAELLLDTEGDVERATWAARKAQKSAGKKNVEVEIALARVDTRSGRLSDAERRLARAVTSKAHEAEARGAMGELLFARGKVFASHQELSLALKLATAGSATQIRLKQQAAKLETLIASGQAVEIEKAAEDAAAHAVKAAEAAKIAQAEVKMTSDRGNTVVRRKGEAAPVPAEGEAAQALPHLAAAGAGAPASVVAAPAPVVAAPAPVVAAPAPVVAAPAPAVAAAAPAVAAVAPAVAPAPLPVAEAEPAAAEPAAAEPAAAEPAATEADKPAAE
ncbi:MAG: putative Zn-dependent protease [Cognaticolwellia sp.]|jgi:predicted Zn-dependent protease